MLTIGTWGAQENYITMKIFKLFAALMMTVVCVSLSSCSKDDENSKNDKDAEYSSIVVGSWHYENTTADTNKQYILLEFSAGGDCTRYEKQNNRQSWIIDGVKHYGEWKTTEYRYSYRWKIDNKKLAIYDYEDNNWSTYPINITSEMIQFTGACFTGAPFFIRGNQAPNF